jgi:hypothetical protein
MRQAPTFVVWLARWLLVAVFVGAVVVQIPREARDLFDAARNGQSESRTQRLLYSAEVGGVRQLDVFDKAAALIPERSSYSVAWSPAAYATEPGVNTAVPFAQYWLLPRRRVDRSVAWILDWGMDPASLAPGARRVVPVGSHVWVIERSGT